MHWTKQSKKQGASKRIGVPVVPEYQSDTRELVTAKAALELPYIGNHSQLGLWTKGGCERVGHEFVGVLGRVCSNNGVVGVVGE
jgi:hypothetical protein